MRLLVLGSTGRTGRAVLERARRAAHHTIAHGRRSAHGADETLVGSFEDEGFGEAVRGADAVLSCLASSNSDSVCSRAAAAVLRADPDVRYLTVAGAGVDRSTDSKGFSDKAIGLVMRGVAGRMLADRQKEIDMLAASPARWTALRPPRLTHGNPTGAWIFAHDRPRATWIDRVDLADAMLEALKREDMIGQAPFVSAAA